VNLFFYFLGNLVTVLGRDERIVGNQYICRQFIERGTALAKATGEDWPAEFVDATLAHLRNHFGVEFS
jgi:hypothetical protein